MTRRQSRREFLALMAAASATLAIAIDAMLPAFADLRRDFGLEATSSQTALIISMFMIGLGVGQPIYGPLADRFGRKPVFISGLFLYILAGFTTAFAPSLPTILAGRFLWGVAAAGPRTVSQAMLRDRYGGDALARAMAVIMSIFLIVPAVAPAVGQAVLQFGSWRYTFAIGPVFAMIVAVWSIRVDESLDTSRRSTLDLGTVRRAFGEVIRTPSAMGNTIALTFLGGAFLPYLGSAERMYGEIYGRANEFFIWFAGTATVMAAFTLAVSRIVASIGTRRTSIVGLATLVGVALFNLIVTWQASGTPTFSAFFIGTTLMVSLNTALTPLLTSRALDDVGHIAGTAASTIGAISFVGGAILSPVVDGAIDRTVTPFVVGYIVFGSLALVAATAADRAARATNRSLA